MTALLMVWVTLAALAQAPASQGDYIGKWTSTDVPPPGTAPMGPPSFEVAVRDGKTIVTFERQAALEPILYRVPPIGGPARSTFFLNQQTRTGMQMYLIQFRDARRAEVDLFMVSSDPAKPGTHVPLGIYVRGK